MHLDWGLTRQFFVCLYSFSLKMGVLFTRAQAKTNQAGLIPVLQRVRATFGQHALNAGILGSSKAFLAASEARARDVLLTREKAEALLKKVRDEERVRASDVNQRRLGLLFAEIPLFETALPNEVHIKDVMPADFLEEEEATAKQLIERQNAFLADNKFIEGSQMAWLFTQTEVQSISKCLQRCTVSTRGVGTVSAGGMDRPTFCRMLLDLDLVGEKVPYFWAVALFDSMAQPMRLCPPTAHHAATAPVVSVATWPG